MKKYWNERSKYTFCRFEFDLRNKLLIKIDNCLQNLEKNTFREVYHIWYLWPVNGVQSDGAGLIAVLLEARALQRGGPGPIVVHCSPGTGRTGTLIALDLGIRQYEITRTVDVPRVVYTIRRDRAGAVKTKEQYAFIYKVIYFLTWPCLFPFESFISFIRLFRLALCTGFEWIEPLERAIPRDLPNEQMKGFFLTYLS